MNLYNVTLLAMKRAIRIFAWTVLFLSVVLNILIVAPYIGRKYSERYPTCFDSTAEDNVVINAVLNASMEMDKPVMVTNEPHGFPYDLVELFRPKRGSSLTNNFYESYNLVGISYYALKYQDDHVIKWCTERADKYIDHNHLNYELKHINQVPVGIFFINVYYMTRDKLYLDVASEIYDWLLKRKEQGGGIKYSDGENEYVDGLGMFVPFLMEYYALTNDTVAKQIAIENIIAYQEYGIDKETLVPFHGYNSSTKQKVGSANWGRGIGWYLLALSYCTDFNSEELYDRICRLPYTQFPLSSDNFDSSTALFFEVYKHRTKGMELDLDFIRTHIRTNGIVTDCSGDVYNFNNYNFAFGDSELCNGLFLMLVSL